jgi:large subunit ribosomal protein L32e
MVTPLVKHKIVKKRTLPFKRYQSDRKVTVKVRTWDGPVASKRSRNARIDGWTTHPIMRIYHKANACELRHVVSGGGRARDDRGLIFRDLTR